MQQQVEIQAQVHCEDGMYWAEVPSHPGLFASGETLDELTEALIEAWVLYTQDLAVSTDMAPMQGDAKPPASEKTGAEKHASGRVDRLNLLVPA
ncbi:MAG TPA: type II toxin-antitoxin system HicB family antitoxin [Solirubrobacteraceae bacterium]|jgi:predicted RNase H-like HicB family nuclease|nr:type II toxin-antitoxin system HicB family antitoxin [Solirubrobacteraceae bacterium]